MLREGTIAWTVVCCALGGMSLTSGSLADEGPPNPNYTPLVPGDYGPASQPGDELADIVFLLDGSGSIGSSVFELQKEGIKNCIVGPYAFIPHDGRVAIAVIQFAHTQATRVEIDLRVIDSPSTAAGLAGEIDAIAQLSGGTDLAEGLRKAIDVFEDAFGQEFTLITSTDLGGNVNPLNPNTDTRLQLGEDIRTATGEAAGMAHGARICTVQMGSPCADPPEDTDNQFLKVLANTSESGAFLNPPLPAEAYPGQPVGHFSCAFTMTSPIPPPPIQDFVMLCEDCYLDSCIVVHAGEADCDDNGVPDVCEPDCNGNGVADPCDIQDETSDDCNENWIPDECEEDCNENNVPDDCDIRDGTSEDLNNNGIPDECEGGPCGGPVHIYVDQNEAITGQRTGESWAEAYETLQQGLVDAAGRQACEGYIFIHVADGTYHPDEAPQTQGNRSATYQLLSNAAVIGGFAGYGAVDPDERLPQAHRTVLSGDLSDDDVPAEFPNGTSYGDNSYSVVTANGTDATALLDGVFVVAGNANVATSGPVRNGGGVYCDTGSPRLFNCVITHNWAVGTGGGLNASTSSPTLVNCIIAGNASGNTGAGIHASLSSDPGGVNSPLYDRP